MNVLIISDEPDRESFRQILLLKQYIKNLLRKKIDLLTFSYNGIFLNGKWMRSELSPNAILSTLQNILKKKAYLVYIVSLELKYLKLVFQSEWSILNLIKKISPQAAVFLYGANSILKEVKIEQKTQSIFFYPRRGVSKLTRDFNNDIIKKIKEIRAK